MSVVATLRLGVTGTDTNVGKTVVSCALLSALRARGLIARGMKPVETGVLLPRAPGTDAACLRRAAGDVDAWEDVCPATYAEPLAPMVAAERAERPLDLAAMDAAAARLGAGADALIVEGAGGLLVPLTRTLTFAGLATHWRLDLVVVAADRLGVLNHTLLTVREAERRGLRVRAVVLNAVRPAPADVAESTNAGVLRDLLGDVPLVTMPYLDEVGREDPVRLAAAGRPLAALLR
ncbi:MAG: dethiobiotin synthase [Gemmatirosa sp.]